MNSNKIKILIKICKEALYKAHSTLEKLGSKGTCEVQDKHVIDISTQADKAISKELIEFFKQKKFPAILYSEEQGKIELTQKPKYTIAIDELDGTDNYYRDKDFLPHCTSITFFNSIKPRFKDALIGGIIEHVSKRVWYAAKDYGCYLNDVRVNTSNRKKLDRRTLVIIDHYASSSEISKLVKIYPTAWVKDFGCMAFHLAGVSSGLFDACLSSMQKADVLGTGYLLIKESGGCLTDWKGNPLDKVKYNFNSKYKIIAASTKELGKLLIKALA